MTSASALHPTMKSCVVVFKSRIELLSTFHTLSLGAHVRFHLPASAKDHRVSTCIAGFPSQDSLNFCPRFSLSSSAAQSPS